MRLFELGALLSTKFSLPFGLNFQLFAWNMVQRKITYVWLPNNRNINLPLNIMSEIAKKKNYLRFVLRCNEMLFQVGGRTACWSRNLNCDERKRS